MTTEQRTTCVHGVPSHGICYQCSEELRTAQFNAAFSRTYLTGPVTIDPDAQRKEARAKWIRENVAALRDGWDLVGAVDRAEYLAKELEKRGYL